ncbi:hypothetical protein [Pseudomonas sp. NPDC079086]|uniref:hypothetical protein n=1 Tax=unclassified Pseudomonas TaxID=196821 RepID=UPI0037C7E131
MSKVEAEIRSPIALAFVAFIAGHAALFALIGLLSPTMPGLWWALSSIPLAMLMCNHLRRLGHHELSGYVGMYATGFAGGAIGAHGHDLFCLVVGLI